MAVNNLGKQVTGMLKDPGVVASAIAGGGIGLVGGAMMAGQRSEEMGGTLSQQAGATFRGGISSGLTGAAIGYGGSIVLTAAKAVLGKK